MKTFLRLNALFLGLTLFCTTAPAQQIMPGKSYSIRCAAMYNDIDVFLSSRFNSVETIVQTNRVESQSVWQFVAGAGGYKMMDARQNGYIFQDSQGRLMITKDASQAKIFMLERAASGNFYFKGTEGAVLQHQSGQTIVLSDGLRAKQEKIQQAEWVVNEISGQ